MVVVIVISVKKNSDAATRRVDYLSHSQRQFNENSKSAAAKKSLDHNTTPAAVSSFSISMTLMQKISALRFICA